MTKVVTDNQFYTAIADAIRLLTGSNKTYTPAQMAPAIIGYIAGGIDVSEVESYLIAEVVNAMKYVKDLGNDDWVHYLIMTDSHYAESHYYNHEVSGAVAKAMMSSGYFDKFIHLGDIVDKGNLGDLAIAEEQVGDLNGQMLYCLGNHELSGNNEIAPYIHDAFTSKLGNEVEWNENFVPSTYTNPYYVYKNEEAKIAILHVAVWGVATGTARTTEVSWIYDTILGLDEGWTVFVMSHAPYAVLGSPLVDCIYNIFALFPTKLRKGCYLGGHYHEDQENTRNDGTLFEKLFENDADFGVYESTNEDASFKVPGTVTDITLTIMSVGIGTNNGLKFYRLGSYNPSKTINANMPYFTDRELTYSDDGGYILVGGISTTGTITTGTANRLAAHFIPIKPNTYYYMYNPSASVKSAKWFTKAEYAQERIDSFVTTNGSRVAGSGQGIIEANVYKFYSKSTSNYMLLVTGTNYDPNDFVISEDVPLFDIGISDVSWINGNINTTCVPDKTTSRMRNDCPIRVNPSTTYRLTFSNSSITNFFVGYAKGPCVYLAVNGTRDGISRATINNGATFTTPSNCNYIFISYQSSAELEGDWTLEEVAV